MAVIPEDMTSNHWFIRSAGAALLSPGANPVTLACLVFACAVAAPAVA
jgi:hypothetical protein